MIISHVRLFMIISHVKIIAFQLSLFCKNYRFSKTVLYIINRKIHGCLEIPDLFLVINLVFPRTHVLFSIYYMVLLSRGKSKWWTTFLLFNTTEYGMYFVISLLNVQIWMFVQFLIIYMKKLLDSDCQEECNIVLEIEIQCQEMKYVASAKTKDILI